MSAIRMSVPLSAIVPSGQNPRGDFGDIDALAETIRATGGEPVNPPVVVRDGNVYRIVDGERRWRALVLIHGEGSDREVSVLAHDTMEAANECVAMLATDDKLGLTEAERARGVQQMLVLGVDTERVARAARTTRGKVAAARKMASRVPEGVQVTLDQMLAASELPDADAGEVLAAGRRWLDVVAAARRRIESEEDRAALVAAAEAAGWEVLDRIPGDGRVYVGQIARGRAAEDVARLSGLGADCAVIESGWAHWAYGPAREDPEVAERRRRADESRAAGSALAASIARFIASGPHRAAVPPALAALTRAARMARADPLLRVEVEREGLAAWLEGQPPSAAEAALALLDAVAPARRGILTWDGVPDERACRAVVEVSALAAAWGWSPSEGDGRLRGLAQSMLDGEGDPDGGA